MKPAHRWWLAALAAVVLLPSLAAVLLLWLVDPDSLRPAIERQARERLGLPLQLRGSLRWSLWPAFTVQGGEGALGEGASADALPVTWRALRFTLQWPGWKSRDWRIEGVQVDGLQVRARQDAQGRWNLASLWRAQGQGATPAPSSGEAGLRLHVVPLRLRDVHLDLLTAGDARPWTLDAAQFMARIDIDDDLRRWTLQDVQFDTTVSGPALASPQPLSVRTARLEYRAGDGGGGAQLEAAPLQLRWAGTELAVKPVAALTFSPLVAEGDIELHGDSLRATLAAHRAEVPPTRDATVWRRFELSGRGRLTDTDVSLVNLQARLDDSHWNGTVSGRWRAPAAWRVDLDGDVLDVDRYRRPESSPGAPFELPVAALRALPLSGTLRLRELRGAGSRVRDARITLR